MGKGIGGGGGGVDATAVAEDPDGREKDGRAERRASEVERKLRGGRRKLESFRNGG